MSTSQRIKKADRRHTFRLSEADIARIPDLLQKKFGNIAAVARALGIDRAALWRRIEANEELKAIKQDIKESFLDDIEMILEEKALAGSTPEMIFYLKTQGRRRGYSERREHKIDLSKVAAEIAALSDAELSERLAKASLHRNILT